MKKNQKKPVNQTKKNSKLPLLERMKANIIENDPAKSNGFAKDKSKGYRK